MRVDETEHFAGLPAAASREQQLWAEVLLLVVEDCGIQLTGRPRRRCGEHLDRLAARVDMWKRSNFAAVTAREFVEPEDNRWRGMVCDFAGIHEGKFVQHCKGLIATTDASRRVEGME